MEVKRTQVSFTIGFTAEELKVVGKALHLASSGGGKLKDDRSIKLARDMNQLILEGQKRVLDEQVDLVNDVLDRLTQEAGVNDPPCPPRSMATPTTKT